MAIQQIYISRGGQPPGPPCSYDHVRQMLLSGAVSTADLAWCEGLADWSAIPAVVLYVEQQNASNISLFGSLLAEVNAEVKVEPASGQGGATHDRSWKKIPAWLGMGGAKKQKPVTQAQLGDEL